jgi:hypothetical protein
MEWDGTSACEQAGSRDFWTLHLPKNARRDEGTLGVTCQDDLSRPGLTSQSLYDDQLSVSLGGGESKILAGSALPR